MKTINQFFKTILIFLLMSNIICAQNVNSYNALHKFTKCYESNLNGAFKSQQIRYSYFKLGFNSNEYSEFVNIDDSKLFSSGYVECYKNNQVKMTSFARVRDTLFLEANKKRCYTYEYNAEDLKDKSQKKTNLKYYSNVFTCNLLLKPNEVVYDYISGYKAILETIYKYTYDNKNRVKEQLEYNAKPLNDSIPSHKTRLKDLYSKTIFFYNEKDQVIKQKTYPGSSLKFNSAGTPSYLVSYYSVSLNTPNLETRYFYDYKGRITRVALYSGQELLVQEDYCYHTTKDYVEKSVYYSDYKDFFANTKKTIRYYNENGDIIKREFPPDYLDQRLSPSARTRFYDYEYDSHNNWIKCYIYLEGTKEGGPTLISEKKLVYYDENTK